MRAAEQIQLASLRHLFYLLGYGRIVGQPEGIGAATRYAVFSSGEKSPLHPLG